MTQKKKAGISRLLEFGGRYRWMTVVACILSGLSSVLMLCPFCAFGWSCGMCWQPCRI